ncbi:DUF6531 domain-containing protein [Xanthomonas sp. NCPPB 2632]|uniref:DUF6531 domain-containing protein n=1 Tax=Xanthomonas sp. NCPPB 2632 TaxID=3240912 RepID=UPI003512D4CC
MKKASGVLGLFVVMATSAQAETVWFALDPQSFPVSESLTHYPTADAACRAAYATDAVTYTTDVAHILPYTAPTYYKGFVPTAYNCNFTVVISGTPFILPHLIEVVGDQCPAGQTFDATTGQCALGSDPQDRRQRGDPDDDANNDPSNCHGDPINAAIGNEFERISDFEDADGELHFARFYNSSDGLWRHSYSASLIQAVSSVTLTFEDGRASVFSLAGNVATAEPNERGALVKSGSNWVYSSPDNQAMTFNSQGQLVSLKAPDGLVQTLTYGYDSTFTKNQTTVKESRGHTLTFTEDLSTGQLVGLTAPGVSATYAYNDSTMLASVSRVLQGKTVSQSYLYEDASNPTHLTGFIDERGVRASTWTYDTKGRAVSSVRGGGVDTTLISYADDGTTTVTNALGHVVTYQYGVVGGTRQMMTVTGSPAPGCPISNSSLTYDARGQIATQTDALGHITAFAYDTQGRVTTKTEAKGTAQERVTTTTWDGTSFRPKTVTTPDRVTTYNYDAKGRLTSTVVSASH